MFKKTKKDLITLLKKIFFSTFQASLIAFILIFPTKVLSSSIQASEIINLSNKERQKIGLDSLTPNNILTQAAFKKASDILEKEYFSHTTPEGKPFYKWIEEEGYNYLYAGENLAIDFLTSQGVVAAWMASPTHKANIINDNYSDIGVVALSGNWQNRDTTIVVQLFGSTMVESPTVLGRTFDNITKDLDISKDNLGKMTADIALLPSVAGPKYLDAIMQKEKEEEIPITNTSEESIALNPSTKIDQEEEFKNLLKTELQSYSLYPSFAFAEKYKYENFNSNTGYPTMKELAKEISTKKIGAPATPDIISKNIMLSGLVLLMILASYEKEIKKIILEKS
jgi:hypothetical protein